MSGDRIAARLAYYRERGQGEIAAAGDVVTRHSGENILALVAVADAVLKLHAPVDRGRVMSCCEGCESVNGEFHEDCCHEWPCPTVEAIARSL